MADGRSDRWRVDAYKTRSGESLMRTFMEGLASRERDDAAALIKLVEERGNTLREPHSKPVERGLFELRRNQVRIFYTFRPGASHRPVRWHREEARQDPAARPGASPGVAA